MAGGVQALAEGWLCRRRGISSDGWWLAGWSDEAAAWEQQHPNHITVSDHIIIIIIFILHVFWFENWAVPCSFEENTKLVKLVKLVLFRAIIYFNYIKSGWNTSEWSTCRTTKATRARDSSWFGNSAFDLNQVSFFFTGVLHARWCKSRRITQPPRRLDLTVSANNVLNMVLLIPGHTPVFL